MRLGQIREQTAIAEKALSVGTSPLHRGKGEGKGYSDSANPKKRTLIRSNEGLESGKERL